tara:strand:- start:76 stop:372 length:297 start_codon:yes stop_codon:yes gene_type:complete
MNSIFPTLPTTNTESKEYQKIKRTYSKDRLLQEVYRLQRSESDLATQLRHVQQYARTQRDKAQLSDWTDVINRFRQLTASAVKQQSRQAAAELRTIWS